MGEKTKKKDTHGPTAGGFQKGSTHSFVEFLAFSGQDGWMGGRFGEAGFVFLAFLLPSLPSPRLALFFPSHGFKKLAPRPLVFSRLPGRVQKRAISWTAPYFPWGTYPQKPSPPTPTQWRH